MLVGCVCAGRSRIKLRKTGEVFSLVPPNSTAHNVIVGSTWVDCHGNFSLANVTTGAKCSLYFTPCGWFSDGRYQVDLFPPSEATCNHSSPCALGGLQQVTLP